MTERTNELYTDFLSDYPSNCEWNCGDLENDIVSEDSESDIR